MKRLFKKSGETVSKRKKQKGITAYVWICFLIFTAFIFMLLWLFQYVFHDRYYQSMKVRDLKAIEADIESSLSNSRYRDLIDKIAFENNLCVLLTDDLGNVEYLTNYMGKFSYFYSDVGSAMGQYIYKLRNKLIASGKDSVYEIYKSERFESMELLLVSKYQDNQENEKLVYVESAIEPIGSTTKIVKEQLIFITFILIELSFIISIFISRRIARPIVKITETAKEFTKGNYNVHFDTEGYSEVAELAGVLNNAGEEIQKVSDLRRDLIANVSHDLRTPLTMVKAYAEMIRDLSGDNPQKRNEHIGVIIDEADRLSNLVNNILELSKLESGSQELHLTKFSIHEKLSEVLSRYTVLSERDGYDFELLTDDDRICTADESQLEQVLYNLINNAVNYCGEDKKIIIRQKNNKDKVRIEIIDHGDGIKKELLPQVFDRYYRDKKVARDKVGTGLGLSIVKGILNAHKFPYGVISEEHKGSTFWFEIVKSKLPDQSGGKK